MSSNWLGVSEGSNQRRIGSSTEAVCSDENVSVDIVKMKHAHSTTGHQARSGDSHESALLAEFLKRRRSHVSHAAFETTDKLVRQCAQLAFIGHTALHALRNGFAALRAFLRVTVCGTCVHRARRTHASI